MRGSATVIDAVRRAALLREEDLEGIAELGELVREVRSRAIALAVRRMRNDTRGARDRARPFEVRDVQLVRYPAGGYFIMHQDATAAPGEWRKLSVVVYLNDGFAGGATFFPGLGLRVRPRTGHALVFPPHYAHQAETVEDGEKLILAFWLGPRDGDSSV